MAEQLKITILTPERKFVDGVRVSGLLLTGSEGQIEILPGHAPMMGTLETGEFSYEDPSKGKVNGVISSGFFRVANEEVMVLAETLETQTEISVARAEQAQKKAEKALQESELTEETFAKYERKLQRAVVRQQVGRGNNTVH